MNLQPDSQVFCLLRDFPGAVRCIFLQEVGAGGAARKMALPVNPTVE